MSNRIWQVGLANFPARRAERMVSVVGAGCWVPSCTSSRMVSSNASSSAVHFRKVERNFGMRSLRRFCLPVLSGLRARGPREYTDHPLHPPGLGGNVLGLEEQLRTPGRGQTVPAAKWDCAKGSGAAAPMPLVHPSRFHFYVVCELLFQALLRRPKFLIHCHQSRPAIQFDGCLRFLTDS
jgi:hypothetical protein